MEVEYNYLKLKDFILYNKRLMLFLLAVVSDNFTNFFQRGNIYKIKLRNNIGLMVSTSQPTRSFPLYLNHCSISLGQASTDGSNPDSSPSSSQFINQGHQNSGSACAYGMTDGNGSSVDIRFL